MPPDIEDNETTPAPLVTDPLHEGVTDDELEAAARAAFAESTPDATDGDEEVAPGSDGGTGEGEASEGAEPSPGSGSDDPALAGMSPEEQQAWIEFRDFLRENPDVALAVNDALQRGIDPSVPATAQQPAAPQAPATEPQVPAGIDLDDPAIAALWQQHQQALTTINQFDQRLSQTEQFVQRGQQDQINAMLGQARTSYQEKEKLSDSEMQTVYDMAGRLQVLPALMSPTDPVTGLPRQVNPLEAMAEAFEIARWNIPALRERAIQANVDDQRAETQRKKKLSSLSGSSGSTPRTPAAVPTNPAERRAAMVADVERMIHGEGASD